MKRTRALLVGCTLAVAAACGCAAIDYGALGEDLNRRYQACLNADMTKTELVMQVGSPTSKETTDDGEIWIYEVVTMGEYGPLRYTVWVLFDKSGVMQRIRSDGHVKAMASPNNRFHGLECRPRSGSKAQGEEFGGIGIRISTEDQDRAGVTVLEVMDGTPAQKAGILAGDQVIQVDDLPTQGMTAEDFTGIVRGRPGTRVTLLVRRAGLDAPREFTMTRAVLPAR